MDPEFWHKRWQGRQIGFHQSAPHPFLERWWPSLGVVPGVRVYVPLCGKSLDMVWLAVRGYHVVGSELSALAVEEFFGEQQRSDIAIETEGSFHRHRSGMFEILQGDALQLTPELLGPVQAAYDRASLVALPLSMRPHYAQHFAALLPAGSRTLLISFEYAQAIKDGPPFSVTPDEVVDLYSGNFLVEELERVDIIDESPKFASAGLTALYEVAYSLTRL